MFMSNLPESVNFDDEMSQWLLLHNVLATFATINFSVENLCKDDFYQIFGFQSRYLSPEQLERFHIQYLLN
jgi:hypothetical protein